MQIDELRGELATLADDIAPFERDVRTLHRRQRRRRVVTSSLVVAFAVLAAATAVAIHRNEGGRVQVYSGPTKEVPSKEITRIDAIVVPATPAVKAALDASPLVDKYALIPHGDRPYDSLLFTPNDGLCALQTMDGYAVDAVIPGTNLGLGLQGALAGRATIYDVSDRFGRDVEVFLDVNASAAETTAVAATLKADPDITSVQHVSRAEAYAIFKKDFVDQPSLVQSTKPSDLPESFRVVLAPERSVTAVVQRYEHIRGVDIVLTNGSAHFFDPVSIPSEQQGKLISPCAKP
jgi:FtsX extracellular domain